jgi:F0F1-type ATP synthase epsilon subunit
MKLTIVTPEGVVCQAEAEGVTLPGALGRFVVLKNHAPLMSLL